MTLDYGPTVYVTAQTDEDGTFEDTFQVSMIPFAIYQLAAVDEYDVNDTTYFKVGIIAMIINPTYGESGTYVGITGIGFTPGNYNLTFGDKLYEDHGTVNAGEAISDAFYVPNVEPGIYDLTVIDINENELTVQFLVTESTRVSMDPALAPNDYNVSIKGYNFADKVGTMDFVTFNSTDDWAMDVHEDGAGTVPTATDSDGNFTGWWIVLPEDTLSLGDYTVNVTDTEGLLVQVPFSVVAARAATIESCDPTGMKKDSFDLTEDVCVNGSGYTPSSSYDMYVVNDVTWTDGMSIPPRVPGTASTVSSDTAGDVPPTLVWGSPLVPGRYDIVVDVNSNGVYDDGVDTRDDMDITTEGFFVIPELPLGTITIQATSILALTFYNKRFRVCNYSSPCR